jgi:hypothetical protein
MNVELDKLLCLIDGKITVYRLKNQLNGYKLSENDKRLLELIELQHKIQLLYDINRNNKGLLKKV